MGALTLKEIEDFLLRFTDTEEIILEMDNDELITEFERVRLCLYNPTYTNDSELGH